MPYRLKIDGVQVEADSPEEVFILIGHRNGRAESDEPLPQITQEPPRTDAEVKPEATTLERAHHQIQDWAPGQKPGTGKTQTIVLDALKGMGAVPTDELWAELEKKIVSHAALATCLSNLKIKGLVQRLASGSWMITQAGADLVE